MKNSTHSDIFLFYGKVAFTGGLLYLLLTRFNIEQASDLLSHTYLSTLLVAILLHALVFLSGAFRWWLLLRHIHPGCTFSDTMPAYYLGLFCNNFLPTGFGGDVVRVTYLAKKDYEISKLISSTLVDRVLGLMVLLLNGLLAVLMQNIFSEKQSQTLLLLISVILTSLALIFVAWLFFSPIIFSYFYQNSTLKKNRYLYKINSSITNFFQTIRLYQQAPWLLLIGVALSLIIQILVICIYAILGNSLGLELPLASYFLIVPLVMLATNIPISLGGLGIRESTLVAMLVSMGADYQLGILLSLLYLLVLWLTTLPGGLVLLKVRL